MALTTYALPADNLTRSVGYRESIPFKNTVSIMATGFPLSGISLGGLVGGVLLFGLLRVLVL